MVGFWVKMDLLYVSGCGCVDDGVNVVLCVSMTVYRFNLFFLTTHSSIHHIHLFATQTTISDLNHTQIPTQKSTPIIPSHLIYSSHSHPFSKIGIVIRMDMLKIQKIPWRSKKTIGILGIRSIPKKSRDYEIRLFPLSSSSHNKIYTE